MEIWAGVNLGFCSLLRASEINQMRQKGVGIGLGNGKMKLAIYIYQSQTDQGQRGCFRTLMETGSDVCPVRSMIYYLNSFDWDCESNEKLFTDDVGRRIRSIIKWSATPNGLVSKRFSTHSLRSGGATAMYVRGIIIEHIRRFGRWASDTFRRYLYRDNQVFRFVSSSMVLATGLLDQLQMTQPGPKSVNFEEAGIPEDDEERFRVGGKQTTSFTQPSPNATDVNLSDIDDWETDDESVEENNSGRDVIAHGCHVDSLPSVVETAGDVRSVAQGVADVIPCIGVQSELTPTHVPVSVLRAKSHVSSESLEEEGTTDVIVGEFLVIEEYTLGQPMMEPEGRSPWSRINPIICCPERSTQEDGKESPSLSAPSSLGQVLPRATTNFPETEGNEGRNALRSSLTLKDTDLCGITNAFGMPISEQDDGQPDTAHEVGEKEERCTTEHGRPMSKTNPNAPKEEYSPTGLSDLSSVDEYPDTPMAKAGSPKTLFGWCKLDKKAPKSEIKTDVATPMKRKLEPDAVKEERSAKREQIKGQVFLDEDQFADATELLDTTSDGDSATDMPHTPVTGDCTMSEVRRKLQIEHLRDQIRATRKQCRKVRRKPGRNKGRMGANDGFREGQHEKSSGSTEIGHEVREVPVSSKAKPRKASVRVDSEEWHSMRTGFGNEMKKRKTEGPDPAKQAEKLAGRVDGRGSVPHTMEMWCNVDKHHV